ncbi:DUF1513 domain-containing protein [Shimia marina]|uniref:Twin-arginine translocation pathway signal n=1 Tax=Shimia marina TaxID=321267 RepID=A0A0P1EMV0_9RHOB|nr:DUF1513 domain-containing protein [Shimia marina]CUH51611.1 hypothetical protein SHM7688_01049 [Shimia marina]SFD44703.1 hypothetical protein SAMN04488037_10157 [Shimia marina]
MTTRRRLLAGLAASSLMPSLGWSSVGTPDFLSAARRADGQFVLAGLTRRGDVTFTIALPARGHAAAAHPDRAEAVAFARRPGTFAVVLDCRDGTVLARLTAPAERHFYGHGAFSADGKRLYTSENDYEAGLGIIGVWDVEAGYRRIGEFASGGVGPHDIKLMPDGRSLVVANGGIETHPDMGRTKLNLPVMQPSLSYLSLDGDLLEDVTLPWAQHKNSIRHLALHTDGTVAFAMQWQGALKDSPPLLGLHQRGTPPRLLSVSQDSDRRLNGYAGSVSLSGDGAQVAITSPRGGILHVFDVTSGAAVAVHEATDVCGIGGVGQGFVYTTGGGLVGTLNGALQRHDLQWDNHLIAVSA